MNLRTIGVAAVAAIALAAGQAHAQEAAQAPAAGDGWDTKYGVLFLVPNPFPIVADRGFLDKDGFDGMVGFQYNLAPQTALRLGVNLDRTTTGVTEQTDAAGLVLKTLPTWTSQYKIGLEGQYMMRLTTASVAPYVGAGARIDFSQNNRNGEQNAPTYGGPYTKYDNYSRTWSAGLLATGGLEWRISKVIGIFAEYRADLMLYSSTKGENKVTPPGGTVAKTTSKESHFLNLSTGIAHGGEIGLVAFF